MHHFLPTVLLLLHSPNPGSNTLPLLLSLPSACPGIWLEKERCQMKGAALSEQSESRTGGYCHGNKSSPDISSPPHQVPVSVSAAGGSRFSDMKP